ncbi:NAD(P)/FAD-dependent oxidoreductase [Nocardia stercoris]|uniref:NAD(P)/FAD-dependent oxidoreductase n=1 Tax=Nocardia stercoris TaxID=2483361 RepID=A0A3M2LD87_9NOCA|nr:NAD(P)/FAD-dependent oxidoreductase [Nocardia stercoris]RMI35432.1 NAD(P)/FAD-dependent oxidoreductase [Nocardia stercoris]
MTAPRFADTFTGRQIHCTAFTPRHAFTGRRVAIIGSGAAAARLLPGIAAEAARVSVFQTDAVWILPRPPVWSATAVRRLPAWLLRFAAEANLRVQVRDSWLRQRLTPDQTAGVALHNQYYRTLQQPGCTLVTWPIARLAPLGIRTVDGIEHRVDTIVYAEDTGHVVTTIAAGGRAAPDRFTTALPRRTARKEPA